MGKNNEIFDDEVKLKVLFGSLKRRFLRIQQRNPEAPILNTLRDRILLTADLLRMDGPNLTALREEFSDLPLVCQKQKPLPSHFDQYQRYGR